MRQLCCDSCDAENIFLFKFAGLSYSVGSLTRKDVKSTKDGDTVQCLRSAGG